VSVEITDEAKLVALVRAAKAYDHDNRPRYGNWGSVSDSQVARLILGALGAMEAAPEQPAPELAALREELEKLAAGMADSAAATAPSKKSDIEAGCANAIWRFLDSTEGAPPGGARV